MSKLISNECSYLSISRWWPIQHHCPNYRTLRNYWNGGIVFILTLYYHTLTRDRLKFKTNKTMNQNDWLPSAQLTHNYNYIRTHTHYQCMMHTYIHSQYLNTTMSLLQSTTYFISLILTVCMWCYRHCVNYVTPILGCINYR